MRKFIMFMFILVFLILAVLLKNSFTGNAVLNIPEKGKPVLVITDVSTEVGKCFSVVKGKVFNIRGDNANFVEISCQPVASSFSDKKEIKKNLGDIEKQESLDFSLELKDYCEKTRFECAVSCSNC